MGTVLPISTEHLCSNVVMGRSMDMLTASQLLWSHREMVSVTSVQVRSSSCNQFGVLFANAHAHGLYHTSWNVKCIALGKKDSYPVMDEQMDINKSLQTWMKTDPLWCKRQWCQFCLMWITTVAHWNRVNWWCVHWAVSVKVSTQQKCTCVVHVS